MKILQKNIVNKIVKYNKRIHKKAIISIRGNNLWKKKRKKKKQKIILYLKKNRKKNITNNK